ENLLETVLVTPIDVVAHHVRIVGIQTMDQQAPSIGRNIRGHGAGRQGDRAGKYGYRLRRADIQRDGDPVGMDVGVAYEQDGPGDDDIGHDDVPYDDEDILDDHREVLQGRPV